MKTCNNGRRGFSLNKLSWNKQGRQAILAAVATIGLGHFNPVPAGTLFFDNNGTGSGVGSGAGGANTWNGTNKNWATSASPGTTAPNSWLAGSVAEFSGAFATISLQDTESVSGLFFLSGAGASTITTVGAGPWALNIGSNPFTITQNTTSKQIIAVPITGSGDMTIVDTNTGAASPINLAGTMTGFTGNIFINDGVASPTSANATSFQLDSPLGDSTKTINMDQWTQLANDNQVLGAGTPGDPLTGLQGTPSIYTIANPIVLNYKGSVNNTTNIIGSANGPSQVIGGTTVTYSKIVTYSGVISSPSGVTTNLKIGGPRGTTVLGAANTYNGSTTLDMGNNNGMLVLAVDNAIPSTSAVLVGNGADIIGPTDLSGTNQTFASLNTVGTNTSATGVGNIYNLGVNYVNGAVTYQTNTTNKAATITLTPQTASTTTFNGDIGDTNLVANPFNDNVPYQGHTTANTNISLTLNGPTGGGINSLTLAPVAALPNGNEYTGPTIVNSGAVLVLGRFSSATFGNAYTVTGGGNVTINSGGALATIQTGTAAYAGGFAGNIEMKSGSALNPGGVGGIGSLSTNSMTVDAGANLNFDFGSNSVAFDQLNLNGALTIDKTANSVLNLGEATGTSFITPGTYTLITANSITTSGSGTGSLLFANGTTAESIGPEQLTLQYTTNAFNQPVAQVTVSANLVQWDPAGNGAAAVNTGGKVSEQGGVWTNGSSTFVDYNSGPFQEITWSNAAARDVLIGNDATQAGADVPNFTGSISLGSNITVGKLTFGAIAQGFNYQIGDNGSGNVLTINGGVNVNNNAASYAGTTLLMPSAEIDVPITLGGSQTWEADPGQFLDVKGKVTGTGLVMTKTGSGTIDFEGAGGSLGTLNAQAGVVQLGALDGLGNATLNLDGGAVVYGATGTSNNPIVVTANGGSLGTATGFTATASADVTATAGIFSAIGTGTTILTGTVSAATFNNVAGSTGVMAFAGPTTIGTFNSQSGIAALAGTSVISVGTLNEIGGVTVIQNDNATVGTLNQSSGTTIFDTNNATIGTYTLTGGTLQIGNGDAKGAIGGGILTLKGTGTGAALGTITLDRSDNWTFTNPLAGGSISLQQNGGGTVTMMEVNTTTAGTAGTGINNGTIALGEDNPLGQGTLTITGPSSGIAALNLAGHNQIIQGLRTPIGTLNLNSQNELITNDSTTLSTLTVNNTSLAEYDGNITGNLVIVHDTSGSANETLAGNVSVNAISLAGGTLQIGAGTTTGSIGTTPVTATAAATLGFARSDNVTVLAPLSGTLLSVAQTGTGMTTIGVSNTYGGTTLVTAGTIQLGTTGALGLSAMTLGATNNAGASTFDMNGFNQRLLKLSDGGTTNFANEDVVNSSSTAAVLSFASGTGTFSGIISGNIGILHDGSGFQGLEGSNTFTGSLNVSAGTISANTWNAPGVAGPFGEQTDGIGTVTLGGPGTTGVLDYTGTTAFVLPRPITMNTGGMGGLRIINATGQLTVPAGSIDGGGGLTKLGNGTIIMQGAQTFGGMVMDVNGNLSIDTVADIGTPSGLGTGVNTAIIQLGDGSGNVGTISFNSPTPQSTNRPFTEVQNGVGGHVILAGDLASPSAVAASNLTLTGGIDLTNSVSVTGGTVIFGGAGMITVATNPIIGPLGNVVLGINNGTSSTTNGTGTLVLSAINTYGGGTYIRNGWLSVSSDGNLGAAAASLNFTGVGTEAGTLLLSGAVNGTRPINVNGGTASSAIDDAGFNSTFGAVAGTGALNKYGSGIMGVASVRLGSSLNVNVGTIRNVSARSMSATSEVTALNIAGTMGSWMATADLGANDMVVDYTGSSPLATIQDQIHSGFNGGHWTGTGITSSAAAAAFGSGHPTAIGYAEASSLLGPSGGTFDGLTVDGTAVLLSYVYSGDANLDGKVNALDFNTLATNYGVNNGSQVWNNGDYNYDGTVDSNDFSILAANYNSVLPTSAALPANSMTADGMMAQSLGSVVPEPGSLSLVALLGAGLLRRRRGV